MKIGIANDHQGVVLKNKIVKYLSKKNEVIDYGTDNSNSVDYPDYAFKVSKEVVKKSITYGILICGTGIGMSIAANKVKGARCAKVDNVEEAFFSAAHNDANIIALSSKLSFRKIKKIIDKFLYTERNIEERHLDRIRKIDNYKC